MYVTCGGGFNIAIWVKKPQNQTLREIWQKKILVVRVCEKSMNIFLFREVLTLPLGAENKNYPHIFVMFKETCI